MDWELVIVAVGSVVLMTGVVWFSWTFGKAIEGTILGLEQWNRRNRPENEHLRHYASSTLQIHCNRCNKTQEHTQDKKGRWVCSVCGKDAYS